MIDRIMSKIGALRDLLVSLSRSTNATAQSRHLLAFCTTNWSSVGG
jgi:hypothetical protein